MKKNIFKDGNGNIHFGLKAPLGFAAATRGDAYEALTNLGARKIWRCHVCNDLSINAEPPRECPTCFAVDAYIEIDAGEFKKFLALL